MISKDFSKAYTNVLHYQSKTLTRIYKPFGQNYDYGDFLTEDRAWFNEMVVFATLTKKLASSLDELPVAAKMLTSSMIPFLAATSRETPFREALARLNNYICGLPVPERNSPTPRGNLKITRKPSPESALIDRWADEKIACAIREPFDIEIAYAIKHHHRLVPTTSSVLSEESQPPDLARKKGVNVTFSHSLAPLSRLCLPQNAYAQIFRGNSAFDAYQLEARKVRDLGISTCYCGCFVISSLMRSIPPDFASQLIRDGNDIFSLFGGRWLFVDIVSEVQRAAKAIYDAIAESRECISQTEGIATTRQGDEGRNFWTKEDDFSVVTYKNTVYTFTKKQAVCVGFLWGDKETPGCGATISNIKNEMTRTWNGKRYSTPGSIGEIFKMKNGKKNDAYGEIIHHKNGRYFIAPPPDEVGSD